MKKHGFTLIELLAVIVILAIIALIATPIVMNVIEKSKKGAAERSAENYISAVETKAATERINGKILEGRYIIGEDGNLCPVLGCGLDDVKKLTIDMNGTKPISGTLLIENGLVTTDSILKIGDYIVSFDETKKSYVAGKTITKSTTDGTLTLYGNITLSNYRIYGNSVQSRLPAGYKECEYLENTGTQWIDTGLKANSNTKVEIKILDFSAVTGKPYLFGARNETYADTNGFALFSNANNTDFQFGAGRSMPTTTLTQNSVIVADKTGLTINGVVTQLSTDIGAFNPNYNMIIGGVMSGGTVQYGSGQKFVYIKIYDNDTLIRHFIPCYRKNDNVAGMYDLVENKFYTNSGTGEFLKGANSPTPDTPIEVESVGDYDETTGKYKIPIKLSNGTEETTTNIYLNEPLRKIGDYADYIDFENKKVVRKVEVLDDTGTLPLEESLQVLARPIEETIELPKISTINSTTILSVDTNIKPSNFEIEYK